MNIPSQISIVLDTLHSCGHNAYLVGGCVRDFVMGRIPGDYDICTSALPNEVVAACTGFHVIETGLQHGTVTVMSGGIPVEVTTFRKDGVYTDHRRPAKVEFVSPYTSTISGCMVKKSFSKAISISPVIFP